MPVDPLSILLGAGATSALGAIGYLGRRYVSGESDRERAALVSDYAGIAATMKREGLSIDDVEKMGELVRTRKRKQATLGLVQEVGATGAYWTQSAMNLRASGSASIADAQLQSVVAELSSIIPSEELEGFERAQIAWDKFRDSQEDFAALQVEGGTMEPLVRSSERETVTLQRVVALKAIVNERKDRLT